MSESPPPRMTSAQPVPEQSIPIDPTEVEDVKRYLEQHRAKKALQAGGGHQDIAAITHEFMRRQLKLIRQRIEDLPIAIATSTSVTSHQMKVLAILDEHIKALE